MFFGKYYKPKIYDLIKNTLKINTKSVMDCSVFICVQLVVYHSSFGI